jgi:hypothetical protein
MSRQKAREPATLHLSPIFTKLDSFPTCHSPNSFMVLMVCFKSIHISFDTYALKYMKVDINCDEKKLRDCLKFNRAYGSHRYTGINE